jgi:hypothetical protein
MKLFLIKMVEMEWKSYNRRGYVVFYGTCDFKIKRFIEDYHSLLKI